MPHFILWLLIKEGSAKKSQSWCARVARSIIDKQGLATPYNGNIMYQYWGTPGNPTKNYYYGYDALNRLLYGVLNTSGTVNNTEQNISYDVMGNITALARELGATAFDNLVYTYTSGGNATNQLQSIVDNSGNNSGLVAGTTNYTYDGNGNMLTDTNSVNTGQNKTVTYNLLNLPQTVKVQHGLVTYTYDATGNKMRKVSDISGVTHTTDYISGIEYDGATTDTLNFIQTEEGKAAKFGSIYDYVYYLGDNLGNTRITFGTKTGSAVTYQSDDYYPFGYEINNSLTGTKNEYLYNKKELQEETQEYDYRARMYDPIIARWNTIDPLAELSRRWSPYNYVEDNPIRFTDPDGMKEDSAQIANAEANYAAMGAAAAAAANKSLWGSAPGTDNESSQSSAQAISDTTKKTTLAKATLYTYKNAPHLKPVHGWAKLFADLNGGRDYNGIHYDDDGNPTGPAIIKLEFPLYTTGPGEVLGAVEWLKLGSTGRAVAETLEEKLAMEEIIANPNAGQVIKAMAPLSDSRWLGWRKMQFVKQLGDGSKIVIHYVGKWENGVLKAVDDFKFK